MIKNVHCYVFLFGYFRKKRQSTGKKKISSFVDYIQAKLDAPEDLLANDNTMAVLWAALVCLPSVRYVELLQKYCHLYMLPSCHLYRFNLYFNY